MALRKLQQSPLCAECERKGLIGVPAEQVDHITRHFGDPKAFWNEKNLQALCRACHELKSAAEESRERRGYSLDVDEAGYPIDPDHPANRKNARSSPKMGGQGGNVRVLEGANRERRRAAPCQCALPPF
jgi:5-methylcytosine-specific restriction protein A